MASQSTTNIHDKQDDRVDKNRHRLPVLQKPDVRHPGKLSNVGRLVAVPLAS